MEVKRLQGFTSSCPLEHILFCPSWFFHWYHNIESSRWHLVCLYRYRSSSRWNGNVHGNVPIKSNFSLVDVTLVYKHLWNSCFSCASDSSSPAFLYWQQRDWFPSEKCSFKIMCLICNDISSSAPVANSLIDFYHVIDEHFILLEACGIFHITFIGVTWLL